MSNFKTPLVVSPLPDGKHWKLHTKFRADLLWDDGYQVPYIVEFDVPAHFVFDFASIPRFVAWLLPAWAKYSKPSVLHDWGYQHHGLITNGEMQPMSRWQVDRVFLVAMLESWKDKPKGKFIAYLLYYGVRAFSWLAWRKKR